MSEENFEQFQKKVCDPGAEPKPLKKLCPACEPNPSFIAPDWRSMVEETYLDEATCEYKICVTINRDGDSFTAREFRDQIGGKKYPTREHLFRTFIHPALNLMLEDLDKLIAKQIVCASHNGPAVTGLRAEELIEKYDSFEKGYLDLSMDPLGESKPCPDLFSNTVLGASSFDPSEPMSFHQFVLSNYSNEIKNPFALELYARAVDFDIDPVQNLLKVLISIPAFIMDSVPNAPTADEIQQEAVRTESEVEIDVNELFMQIQRLKIALSTYSKFQSYFYQTQDGFLKFKESDKDFYCSSYSSKIDTFYDDLKAIAKKKNWNIRSTTPSVIIKNADKIKITFMIGENGNPYNIQKVEVKIEGCEYQKIAGKNSKFAKKYNGKPTVMNYIAKLAEIDTALRAQESYPWLDFCVKFTYPLLVVNYGTLNEESVRDSMGECVANNIKEFGGELRDYVLNEALNLIQSMAYEFNKKQSCADLLADPAIEKKYFEHNFTPGLDAKKNVDATIDLFGEEEAVEEEVNELAAEITSLIQKENLLKEDKKEKELEKLILDSDDFKNSRQFKNSEEKMQDQIDSIDNQIKSTQDEIKSKSALIKDLRNDTADDGKLSRKSKNQLRKNAARRARKANKELGNPYVKEAKKLAIEELKTQDTLLSSLVDLETFINGGGLNFKKAAGKAKGDEKKLLERLSLCNVKGLTIQAIRCLFSGVTQEAAFKKMINAALKAMDIDVLGFFIQALPPDKQTELREMASKKWADMPMPWEEGYKSGSTEDANPYLSYLGTNSSTQGVEARKQHLQNKITSINFDIAGKEFKLSTSSDVTDDARFKINVEIEQLEIARNDLEKQLEQFKEEDFSKLPPERQQELIRAQVRAQGTFGAALGDIQEELVSMYIENIMDVMEVDELMSIIERFPGGGLIQRYVNKVNCSIQGLNNPPSPPFLSTLSFDLCGEGNLGLSVPDKLKEFKMPRVYNKSFLRILRNKFIAKVETIMTQILVKMILKLIQTVDDALCKSINTLGQFSAQALTGGGQGGFDEAFRDAFCPNSDEQELKNIQQNAMNNALGKGGLNAPNTDAYDCLFQILNATMSKQEVVGLLTTNPSSMDDTVVGKISQLVNAKCPDLAPVFGDPDDIKDAFGVIGKFIPPELRIFLRDQADQQPEGPIFDSICLTQDELDKWNDDRRRLYISHGLDEDTATELVDKANERALDDLGTVADMLQKGPHGLLEEALDDLLRQSDPACESSRSAIILEDEDLAADKLGLLNEFFKNIERKFINDLIGEKHSLLGNILIDTYGNRFNKHERRVNLPIIYPNYVDTEEQFERRKEQNPFQVDVPILGGFPHNDKFIKGTYPETVGGAMINKLRNTNFKYDSNGEFTVQIYFKDNQEDPEYESRIKFKSLKRRIPTNVVSVDETFYRKISKKDAKALGIDPKDRKSGFIQVPDSTKVRSKMKQFDQYFSTFDYSPYEELFNSETVVFRNLLAEKSNVSISNSQLIDIQEISDTWNTKALNFIKDSIITTPRGGTPIGFSFGADEQQKVSFFDLLYVNPESKPDDQSTWFYNKSPQDKVLGKSATDHPRVHFLDPSIHGGSYLFPQIYVESATYNGWLGMLKTFIPEMEVCDDVDNGFLRINEISRRSKEIEGSLPMDTRLSQAPECRFEIPYDRQLTPVNHGLTEGIVLATIRTYGTEFLIRTLPIMGSIQISEDNFDDSLFLTMAQKMEYEFRLNKGVDLNVVKSYTYYLLFLEQVVQVVQRRIKDGLIEETEEIKMASERIARVQNNFERLNLFEMDATMVDQIRKGSAIAGFNNEWEEKYLDGAVNLTRALTFLSPFKLNLSRKLAVIHDSKATAEVFLAALFKNEMSKLSDRLLQNLRPRPHIQSINKFALSKSGIITFSKIRSGETIVESDVVEGGSNPDYGTIRNCPASNLQGIEMEIPDEGIMFLEKYIKTISKEGEEQVMTPSEFHHMIVNPAHFDQSSKLSDNFGNAQILADRLVGSIGVKFGVRLIYIPSPKSNLSSNLDQARNRVGKIGINHHIPLATFEQDLIDKRINQLDFTDENLGEELKCYVDRLVETGDFNLLFGGIIKTTTFTSLFGIYSFYNFLESIGIAEVEPQRQDNVKKKWKRKVFDDTKILLKKQFRSVYRVDDDDIKKDNRLSQRQLDAQFVSNLLPDVYLGLDSSVRWWQSWRIVDIKPYNAEGTDCLSDFQKLFRK